jgi:chemotaxis response regulator CheB
MHCSAVFHGWRISMKDIHALVVDDTPEVRKLIRMVLWGMGIKAVEEASHGLEALSILEKRQATGNTETPKFDIVVCDIADDFITKPYTVKTVEQKVRKAAKCQ